MKTPTKIMLAELLLKLRLKRQTTKRNGEKSSTDFELELAFVALVIVAAIAVATVGVVFFVDHHP